MANEIVLEAGTEYVPVAEIPSLIASALNPRAAAQPITVSYFTKTARQGANGESARWRGWPINDDDKQVLACVWADLPPVPDKATEDEIKPYLEAFKEKSEELDWDLGVVWTNPTLNADILRIDAEEEHWKEVKAAIHQGRLKAVMPHTRLPVIGSPQNSVVAVDELSRFVEQFNIEVRVGPCTTVDELFQPASTNATPSIPPGETQDSNFVAIGVIARDAAYREFPPMPGDNETARTKRDQVRETLVQVLNNCTVLNNNAL